MKITSVSEATGQWFTNGEHLNPNDTLWDGRDCHSSSTCCSLHNPTYFINTPTTDDIEFRMCNYGQSDNIVVELVELYVK